MVRHQVDIDEVVFDFMSVCGTTNAVFILRRMQEIYLAVSKEIKLGCLGELLSANCSPLSETLEGLKRRLEAWSVVLESKELRVNFKKKK